MSVQTNEILRPVQGITTIRTLLGKSVRTVAEETGLSPSTVIRLERGDHPTPNANRRIREWIKTQTSAETITELILATINSREPNDRKPLLNTIINQLQAAQTTQIL
jgi:transcriptional regulator with XRE-family HTH domain